MNSRSTLFIISIVAVVALVVIYLTMIMSPPNTSNEEIVRLGETDWSIETDPTVYGASIWATFADYSGGNEGTEHQESIKVYFVDYLGGVTVDKETMSWDDTTGTSSEKSLTLENMITHWQGSSAIFKFNHKDDFYKVSFSVSKLENGQDKYTDITEAWNEGELLQTVEMW